MDQATTSVYRYYDKSGILIYVGITSRGVSRNREHNSTKSWWEYVGHQDVEHFPSRAAAHRREVELITTHRPPFNVQHNPDAAAMRSAYGMAQIIEARNESPEEILRRCPKREIPLEPFEPNLWTRNSARLRTTLEYSPIARRLAHIRKTPITQVSTSCRVGMVRSIEITGPFAVIQIDIRSGVDLTRVTAHPVKSNDTKGDSVYVLKKLKINAGFEPTDLTSNHS